MCLSGCKRDLKPLGDDLIVNQNHDSSPVILDICTTQLFLRLKLDAIEEWFLHYLSTSVGSEITQSVRLLGVLKVDVFPSQPTIFDTELKPYQSRLMDDEKRGWVGCAGKKCGWLMQVIPPTGTAEK